MPLLLVQAFLNTRYFEGDSDLLSDPETARRWLVDAQLLPRTATVTAAELEEARSMRESIRRLLSLQRGEAHGALALRPLRELVNARTCVLDRWTTQGDWDSITRATTISVMECSICC